MREQVGKLLGYLMCLLTALWFFTEVTSHFQPLSPTLQLGQIVVLGLLGASFVAWIAFDFSWDKTRWLVLALFGSVIAGSFVALLIQNMLLLR